jgi:hypothetical protein
VLFRSVYYSVGVAAYMAESDDFYAAMTHGDEARWPRGHERRHMRGQVFHNCLNGLRDYEPESVVDYMTQCNTLYGISKHVQEFNGFGQWISWKIADMTERVLQKPVDFSNAELGVYKDPVKGAALIKFGDQKHTITTLELHGVVNQLLNDFKGYKAPPFQDRSLNIQEIETILCKYKSYINGHYPLGLDTEDIYHGLDGWGDLAQELKQALEPYYSEIINDR